MTTLFCTTEFYFADLSFTKLASSNKTKEHNDLNKLHIYFYNLHSLTLFYTMFNLNIIVQLFGLSYIFHNTF